MRAIFTRARARVLLIDFRGPPSRVNNIYFPGYKGYLYIGANYPKYELDACRTVYSMLISKENDC